MACPFPAASKCILLIRSRAGYPAAMRTRRRLPLTFTALAIVVASGAACSKAKDEPVITAPPESTTTTTTAPATTTTAPLTREAVILAPNGLGPVRFGDPAALAVARLTPALGPPDKE